MVLRVLVSQMTLLFGLLLLCVLNLFLTPWPSHGWLSCRSRAAGLFQISNSNGSIFVYCDGSDNVLIQQSQPGGCNESYTAVNNLSPAVCGYAPESTVSKLAQLSSTVTLFSWGITSVNADGCAIASHRNSTTWQYSACSFSGGWKWEFKQGQNACVQFPLEGAMWPDMFWGCGYADTVHWISNVLHVGTGAFGVSFDSSTHLRMGDPCGVGTVGFPPLTCRQCTVAGDCNAHALSVSDDGFREQCVCHCQPGYADATCSSRGECVMSLDCSPLYTMSVSGWYPACECSCVRGYGGATCALTSSETTTTYSPSMNSCAALAEPASVHGFATQDSTLPIAAAITPAAALNKEWNGSMPEGVITSAPLSRRALSSDLPLALNLSVVVLRDSGGNSSGSADDRWRLVRITLDRQAEASSRSVESLNISFTTIATMIEDGEHVWVACLMYPPPSHWLPTSWSEVRAATLVLRLVLQCPTDANATSMIKVEVPIPAKDQHLARSTVLGNLVLWIIGCALMCMLSGAYAWCAGASLLKSAEVLGMPSPLLPLVLATIPSTASGTFSLLVDSSPGCAGDIAIAAVGVMMILCPILLLLVTAIFVPRRLLLVESLPHPAGVAKTSIVALVTGEGGGGATSAPK
jgi:hypothetical protein